MFWFVNIHQKTGFSCEDDAWVKALTLAKEQGWRPEGTKYDFSYSIDELFEEEMDAFGRLFTLISTNNRYWDWQGSYTERENQLVLEHDALSLYQALMKSPGKVPGDLIRFIASGSFRILAF